MTTVAYALGHPRRAASRGGDCRARDLGQGRDVYGPHHFAPGAPGSPVEFVTEGDESLLAEDGESLVTDADATTGYQISNGMLRVTVGVSGTAPSLTVEAYTGQLVVGDYYTDTYTDTYAGSLSAAAWLAMGTIIIDSPSVSALLTAVRVARINPEIVTLRLVAPLMADAFVTLRRGERMVRIVHGDRRAVPQVDVDRRVRLTDSFSPTGTAYVTTRVEEALPAHDGFPRWVAAIDPVTVNAGAFSVTASSVTTARFGAGVGTLALDDTPADHHSQLGDATRPVLVIA